MVRWPAPDRMSKVSASIVERFKKTAQPKELEQDAREWVLANWPWMPEPRTPSSLGDRRQRAADGDDTLRHARR